MNKKQGRILVCIFLGLILPLAVYSDARGIFRTLSRAVASQVSKIHIRKLEKKYKNQRISGFAYFLAITEDDSGNPIANLSTESDSSSPTSVGLIIFLKRHSARHRKLKRGDPVHLNATFEEIRMRSIIAIGGIITKVKSKSKRD
ncbi:MAG: hypothetical protein NG737_07545 [Omnitrophica bacterium]|nr:hypothetical protein [Candidatus Omnitrophota bacterium]